MNNKRLGIGFIGGGFITRFHIQSLLAVRDVDVIGVMSKTLKSLPIAKLVSVTISSLIPSSGGFVT